LTERACYPPPLPRATWQYRREWRNPYAEDSPAGRIAAAKRAAALAVRERRQAAEAAVDAAMQRTASLAFRAAEPSWAAIAARARGISGITGGGGSHGGRASPAQPLPPAERLADVHSLRLQEVTAELSRRREAVAREQARSERVWSACASVECPLLMMRSGSLPPAQARLAAEWAQLEAERARLDGVRAAAAAHEAADALRADFDEYAAAAPPPPQQQQLPGARPFLDGLLGARAPSPHA
jgi:hypothetical protein